VLKVKQGQKVPKVLKVLKDSREKLVLKAPKVLKVLKDNRVSLELKAFKVLKVKQGNEVKRVKLAPKDKREIKGKQGILEYKEFRVKQDILGQME